MTANRLTRLEARTYALPEHVVGNLLTPTLVVHMALVRRNIAAMLGYLGGDPSRWRPHLKTTKMACVYEALLDAGLRYFKCATLREARTLLDAAAHLGCEEVDLLIAYPLYGPALQAADRLAHKHPGARLSVLSEDPAHCGGIPDSLGVFVDVDPGMQRTGVPLERVDAIAQVATAAGDRLRGIHFYDGHIHAPSAEQRRQESHSLYAALIEISQTLAANGLCCEELVTSGTPTFRYALEYAPFQAVERSFTAHRVSPGTVVFHDLQYDALLEDLDLTPAAVLATRVVSRPGTGVATCDAGSKALAAEAGDPAGFVVGHPELLATRPSEEHLPLRLDAGSNAVLPARGELLMLVPRHICPTVNLAEKALVVEADGSTRVVAVAARAHDLLASQL